MLFLRHYADLDYDGIAEVVGNRRGTVAAALHDGLSRNPKHRQVTRRSRARALRTLLSTEMDLRGVLSNPPDSLRRLIADD
jgi:hypothetical protein